MARLQQNLVKLYVGLALLTACHPLHAVDAEPLRWKFAPGQVNRYRMDQTTESSMDLGAGQVESRFQQTIDWHWRVESVADDGAAKITQTIKRIQIEIAVPGGQSASYDSASGKPAEGFAAMLKPLVDAMTAGSFTATMTPRGEVVDLDIPDAALAALANSPGAAALGELATGEGFKKAVSQASFVLPEELEPGTEWTVTTEVKNPNLGVQKIATTYKYAGPKEVDGQLYEAFTPLVTISFEGQPPQPMEITGQESSGEVLFNRTAGRLERSAVKTGTDIKFTVGGREILQKSDTSIEMQRLDPESESEVSE